MSRPSSHLTFRLLALVAVLGVPHPAAAQDADPLPPSFPAPFDEGLSDDPERLEDQQRLVWLVAEAFEQFPELQAQHTQLQTAWSETMNQLDPETAGRRARLEELGRQLLAARGSRDQARVRGVLTEARPLQAALSETAMEAAAQPDMRQGLRAFRAELLDRMSEIDPGAPGIVARSSSPASEEDQ